MNIKTLIAALALLASGAANANLIKNGDFELSSASVLTDWTVTGHVGVATEGSGSKFYFGAGSKGQNGKFAAAFNNGDSSPNGTLSQIFATVAGMRYDLTFDYGVTLGPDQSISFQVLGANMTNLLIGGTVSDKNPETPLKPFSYSFVADGSLSKLVFSDVSTNPTVSTDGLIDNVIVQRSVVQAAAVPEPASLAIIALGMLGLGAARRRKQA